VISLTVAGAVVAILAFAGIIAEFSTADPHEPRSSGLLPTLFVLFIGGCFIVAFTLSQGTPPT